MRRIAAGSGSPPASASSSLHDQRRRLTDAAAALAADAAVICRGVVGRPHHRSPRCWSGTARAHRRHRGGLAGTGFRLRARTGDTHCSRRPSVWRGPRRSPSAPAAGQASGLALVEGRPHQLALVPVKAPGCGLGRAGLPIDDRLGAELHMRHRAGPDTARARFGERSPGGTHSTLGDAAAREIAAQPWNGAATRMAPLRWRARTRLRLRWTSWARADRRVGSCWRCCRCRSTLRACRASCSGCLLGIGPFGAESLPALPPRCTRRAASPRPARAAGCRGGLGVGDYATPPWPPPPQR